MKIRSLPILAVLSALGLVASAAELRAQNPPNTFASGLTAPMKIIFSHQGNLLVAEAGTVANTGRISLVTRPNGIKFTLIEGLPSGLSRLGNPNGDPSGPSGLALRGDTLFLTIGGGDAAIPGPAPGSELLNPAPSSQLLSSLLSIRASVPLDQITNGFTLTMANQAALSSGSEVVLTNSAGQTMTVRLVVNFPDAPAEPRQDVPNNVRLSNPFGVVSLFDRLYVNDASQNLVYRIDPQNGTYDVLTRFSRLANPLPIGAPMIDSVPDSIRVSGGQLLVSFLAGFPFPPGVAEVRRVNPANGASETLISGLTSAIDVLPVGDGSNSHLVLEFSANMRENRPGRLQLVYPSGDRVALNEGLIAPTSMAFDRRTGEVFITQLTGHIIRLTPSQLAVATTEPASVLPVVGSTRGAFGTTFKTFLQLHNPNPFPIAGVMVLRHQGIPGSATDPVRPYSLEPFATQDFGELLQANSGIGSMDFVPTVGPPPVSIARITTEAATGGCGSSVIVDQVPASEALFVGSRVVLLAPADTQRTRFNVGVRSLGSGAFLRVTVRNSTGGVARQFTKYYPPHYFEQVSDISFSGAALTANQSLEIVVEAGSAIIYGAYVDNVTQSPSLHIARRIGN